VPFYLNELAGYSIAEAAGWMMILVAGYSLAAMGAGRLQKHITSDRQALLGSLVALTGAALFAIGFVASDGAPGVVAGCALLGVGFGLMLPEGQRGFGAALLPLGINLGSVVGVIVCAELREWHLPERQADAQAFFAIVVALALAGAGFCWQGRTTGRQAA
jgi:hypothetical protein